MLDVRARRSGTEDRCEFDRAMAESSRYDGITFRFESLRLSSFKKYAVRTSFRFLAPDDRCSYLPDQMARMEYERVAELSADEYAERMMAGWRRFGHMLFRPRCHTARPVSRCVSTWQVSAQSQPAAGAEGRTRVSSPSRSVSLESHGPGSTSTAGSMPTGRERGWNEREEDPISYHDSFVSNPFPTEEWAFRMDGCLVGLGLVDSLSVGLSAIYFVHDPDHHHRGLGTWNILCLIEEARRRGLPHLYLGYWVADCLSLAYKANFRPHELLGKDGQWHAS